MALPDAESFAKACRLKGDFSCCWKVARVTPLIVKHELRDIVSAADPNGEAFAFGVYAYGAFAGITNLTKRHCEFARYLNCFLRLRDNDTRWSSLALNCNAEMKPHKDVHNLVGSMNLIVGFGDYVDGKVWIEDCTTTVDDDMVAKDINDRTVMGRAHDCKHRVLAFPPDRMHCPESWKGERWTLVAFASRGVAKCSRDELSALRELDFPVGYTPPEAYVAQDALVESRTVSFVDEVEAYPTEQAIKRKAVLASGHKPTRRKQQVEQHRDDCGDSLDSIVEFVETVPWHPHLMGAMFKVHCMKLSYIQLLPSLRLAVDCGCMDPVLMCP
eukprot:s4276_g3.t1